MKRLIEQALKQYIEDDFDNDFQIVLGTDNVTREPPAIYIRTQSINQDDQLDALSTDREINVTFSVVMSADDKTPAEVQEAVQKLIALIDELQDEEIDVENQGVLYVRAAFTQDITQANEDRLFTLDIDVLLVSALQIQIAEPEQPEE